MGARTVLGLDLGTKVTGWSVMRAGKLVAYGTFTFGPWAASVVLPSMIVGVAVEHRATEIYYERVGHHMSTAAAHSWGTTRACVEQAAALLGLTATGLDASAIKKDATGNGNAKKALMVDAVLQRFGVSMREEDAAEATCVADFGWRGGKAR